MGSSRLPGKVLLDLCGKPMLMYQIERIQKSSLIDQIVVATSTNPLDDPIHKLCDDNNISCFRGSEDDVLGRVSALLHHHNAQVHVECYGDSPFADYQIIDQAIGLYLKNSDDFDYLSNSLTTTFPPGMEVSVYHASTLLDVNQRVSVSDPLREHCGYNITRYSDIYQLFSFEAPAWFNFIHYYFEVDTFEDFKFIKIVAEHFRDKQMAYFSLSDMLQFIRANPQLADLNSHVERRWSQFRN